MIVIPPAGRLSVTHTSRLVFGNLSANTPYLQAYVPSPCSFPVSFLCAFLASSSAPNYRLPQVNMLKPEVCLFETTGRICGVSTFLRRLCFPCSSNPGAIFAGDSYFQNLPAGTVNSSNVRATAATTQSNLNPSNSGSSNLFKDGKFLHLRWLWWAVIGGGIAALCLFCCICSSIGGEISVLVLTRVLTYAPQFWCS